MLKILFVISLFFNVLEWQNISNDLYQFGVDHNFVRTTQTGTHIQF